MKYPSPQDIEDMRSRGYDRSVIEEAVGLSRRWHEKEVVKETIRLAFLDVRLGDGVGLYEAQGLDDYLSEEACARYRALDETADWTVIAPERLNACNSSLSFFDAQGMRFHLPAYLIADLDGEYGFGMDFCLTMSSSMEDRFGLLDQEQRKAVRAFLRYILDEPEYSHRRESIQAALSGYWDE